MIIRKPFKFLIRHFKIINFIIFLLLIYITYRTGNIVNYFKSFVESGYVNEEINLSQTYIGFLFPLVILLIILVNVIIYILFKSKDKDTKLYLLNIIFYIVLLVAAFMAKNILYQYETSDIQAASALMYRDISNFLYYPNYLFILLAFINVIGYDLTRFEFTNLQDEIDIEDEDDEELEINVGVKDYKIKRIFRRSIRELKYYIIENKLVFSIIGAIILVILFIFLGGYIISLNKSVRVDQSFNHTNFNISVEDSMVTNLDYQGNIINENTYFLALKIGVTNKTNTSKVLDTDNFWLDLGNYYKYPTLDRSGKFIDIGEPYFGEKIKPNEKHSYIIVYELNNKEIKASYNVKILDSITYKEGIADTHYKQINIKPSLYTSVNEIGTYNIKDTIDFNKTSLYDSSMVINSYEIANIYTYNYQSCINNICKNKMNAVTNASNTDKSFIILDANFQISSQVPYSQFSSMSKFFEDFATIDYYIDERKYTTKILDLSPSNDLVEKYVLQVDKNINLASKIKLNLIIRNKKIIINLK